MGRLLHAMPWLLGALLVAAMTHVLAILILPRVATRDAYDRLAPLAARDHMTLIPASTAADGLPAFRDPATAQAVCFFDLGRNAARIQARVEDGRLLTLSFRTREGKIFYAMTDRAAFKSAIDIRLLSDDQLAALEGNDEEGQGLSPELRLRAPALKGMVIATTLVTRPSDREDAEARLKKISCGPEAQTTN